MKQHKLLIFQAILYAFIGLATPIATFLSGSMEINSRAAAAAIVLGLIGAASSLKAFLSTNFADSKQADALEASKSTE